LQDVSNLLLLLTVHVHSAYISAECAATAHVHRGGSGDGKK